MYSLMIVDDEYMILRGMSKILDWEELEINVVKTERSPIKALEYLKQHKVDILISDMNMDELAGTKFLPEVRKSCPNIQIIVLSGFDNFSYAKASLEQGVVDYLVKPVDPDELEAVIVKTKKLLKKDKKRQENSEIARGVYVKDILNGQKMIEDLDQSGQEYYILAIFNANNEMLNKVKEDKNIVGIYSDKSNAYIIYKNAGIEAKKLARSISNQGYGVIISDIVSKDNIPNVASKLNTKLEWFKFYGITNQVIDLASLALKSEAVNVSKLASELDIDNKSIDEFRMTIVKIMELLKENFNKVSDAKYFARLIVISIYGSNKVISSDLTDEIIRIEHAETSSNLVDILTDFYAEYRKSDPDYPETVIQVIQIVKNQYKDPLSLTYIAEQLHMNSVYLGALFKKNTDISFAQYLNSYRVSRSIEMMRTTNRDINDIAYEVGYQNSNYFFRVFKKQTKMAPSEYRKMIRSK